MKHLKILKVKNLKKNYNLHNGNILKVLDGISFELRQGEFLVILGPNGCGKSTLVKILTGLEKPTSGEIEIPEGIKSIGYAPQREVLIPWKTIFENLKLVCEVRGIRLKEEEIKDILESVELKEFANSYPFQLSIGMRQKVNVIRALLMARRWLILDEPFSAVDVNMRLLLNRFTRMIIEPEVNPKIAEKISLDLFNRIKILKRITNYSSIGVLYITHSVDEAIMMADRIMILTKKPTKIYDEIKINFEDENGRSIIDPLKRKSHPKFSEYFSKVWNKFMKVFSNEVTTNVVKI
ncbi:MAG TPA: ABC transporter ATP-binding protein [Nautiliaceae bacterium]|nr:ABC transporter ATP-binding protein [Nautiliaceae bacterium]